MKNFMEKVLKYTAILWAASLLLLPIDGNTSQPYFARLPLQGVTFQVECPNESSINQVTISAQTPERLLGSIEKEADGTITNAEVADLDANGFPEVYIYVNSAGSGSYGSLIAYASNRNLSVSEIYLPPLEQDPETAKGYMGHDEFAIVETTLVRRFPVYLESDVNAAPSGGMRQVLYRLVTGEAGWRLEPYKIVDY